MSTLAKWPPKFLFNLYRGAISPGAKQSGHESDHTPPSSAEIKNDWSYTSTSPSNFLTRERKILPFTMGLGLLDIMACGIQIKSDSYLFRDATIIVRNMPWEKYRG